MATQIKIQVTDTFGGEANYGWVRNYTIPNKDGESTSSTIRRAKRAAGISERRHRAECYGDEIRLYFVRANIVLFIEWQ